MVPAVKTDEVAQSQRSRIGNDGLRAGSKHSSIFVLLAHWNWGCFGQVVEGATTEYHALVR